MEIDKIRQRAQEIWESEGRPEGQHDRHWQQAEQELSGVDEPSQTSSLVQRSATTRPEGRAKGKSDAIPSKGGAPGSFQPGELASENK
jgi:hypothetical protein